MMLILVSGSTMVIGQKSKNWMCWGAELILLATYGRQPKEWLRHALRTQSKYGGVPPDRSAQSE